MLVGIKLKMVLIQETTKYQISASIKTLKLLFPISILNKEFTEDGILKDSQSQQQKKLTIKPQQQNHPSMLSKRNLRNKKIMLSKLIKMFKVFQLQKTLLKLLMLEFNLHQQQLLTLLRLLINKQSTLQILMIQLMEML